VQKIEYLWHEKSGTDTSGVGRGKLMDKEKGQPETD
jgi:hypothetical protein